MVYFLLNWIALSLALLLTSKIVPRFEVVSFTSALVAVAVIGLFNALIRPILWLLTLPLTILTIGLFTFVLNAIILRLAAGLLKGFNIDGWLPAILGAVVLAIVQTLFAHFLGVPGPVF